ncbi:MAG: hypothetical protein K8F31_04615 [Roseovarius sp.]|nr:hypothetical protein [Roseovarius sp.]
MDSYESFREVFRDEIRQGRETYPDRARWLQSLAQRGEMGALYAASAESALDNIEGFFASTDHRAIEDLATAVEEDIKLVESVARGLKSRGYRPGPLVPDPAGGLNSEHSIRTPQQWMREAINGQAPIPPSAPPRSGADT